MMIYPYRCRCGHHFDVVKSVKEIEDIEYCGCGEVATRYIARNGYFYGSKVEDAEYCPALGQVVKNSAHRRQLAKENGLIEVGNDSGKYFEEKQKERDQENRKFYDSIAQDRIVLANRG